MKNFRSRVFRIGTSGRRPFRRSLRRDIYETLTKGASTGMSIDEISHAVGEPATKVLATLYHMSRDALVEEVGGRSRQNGNTIPEPSTHREAVMLSMLTLEKALALKVKEKGSTPDLNRGYVTYQKIKALALRPGTEPEGENAARAAVRYLVGIAL